MDFKERLSTPVMLENPRADRVRGVVSLVTRRGRAKTGQFLVEGPQAVREALKYHRENAPVLDSVYITEAAFDRHRDIVELMEAVYGTPTPEPGRRVFMRMVTEPVLSAMTEAVSPQGVVAVAFQQDSPQIPILAGARTPRLAAALVRVQDPGNAGTILRAADAAGADLLVTTAGSVDLYNPKTVRASAGSLFHLPIVQGVDLEQYVEAARAQGMGVLAADGYGEVSLDDLAEAAAAGRLGVKAPLPAVYDLARPTLWLFGNEAGGLSGEEKAIADAKVAVPIHGRAESLNVSMAAAVCLYASALALSGGKP